MYSDKSLATLLRALQSESDEQDVSRYYANDRLRGTLKLSFVDYSALR